MDLDKFVKYCLFIEETGRELEQRALNGKQMPEVLRSRAPGVYRQSNLGIRRVFEPAGKFGPTPDIPAVFPLRTPNPRGDSFNLLRQQLGHRALDLTRYYATAGLCPAPKTSRRPTDRRTGR